MGTNEYGRAGGVERGVARSDRFIPWTHRLGQDGWKLVEFDIEPIQALTAAGLDFEVEVIDLSTLLNEPLANEHRIVHGTNGEGVFGMFKEGVGLIQYRVLAEFADEVIRAYPGAKVVSAFGLHRNKQAVMCLELPQEARSLFGANVRTYLIIASSHDGTMKFLVCPVHLIVECMNTLAMGLGGNKRFVQVKHTASADERVALAKAAVREALAGNKDMAEFMAKQVNSRLTAREVDQFIIKVIGDPPKPKPDESQRALTLWQEKFAGIKAEYKAPWNRYAQRTAWGAFMAINGYEQWAMPVRKTGDSGEHVRTERIVEATVRGTTPLTDKALALLK